VNFAHSNSVIYLVQAADDASSKA